MKTLTELANEFGTDKGTLVGNRHHYTLVYEKLFSGLRERELRLLEIGLSIGGPELGAPASRQVIRVPSIDMWLSYFPRAFVTGLDISDCSHFKKERFSFISADCGDQAALRSAVGGRQFDIVLDDGSHASFHQQLTMLELFRSVAPGGYYIVEDLDWQPEAYERELPPVAKTADLLLWLTKAPAKEAHGLFNERVWRGLAAEVDTVALYRKCDLEALSEGSKHLGLLDRWRNARRLRRADRCANPIKLAVIKKK